VTQIDIPDLVLAPVELQPREVRGGDDAVEPAGQVLLGGPFWAPLPADYLADDPDSQAFLDDPSMRWLVGVMAFSLQQDAGGERFERAWLTLTLAGVDGAEPPVAWSMKPDRIASDVKRSTSLSLGPKLTIADVGIEASVQRGVERVMQDVSVLATGEKTPSPRWTLSRTPSAPLTGSTRLAVVVRAPRDVAVTTAIDVGYVTARRQAVFFWPRTDHTRPQQTGVLPGQS
jgi:hypothetical protein